MKTEEIEKIIKEIKEKEDFLSHLKRGDNLNIGYWNTREFLTVFTLSKKESGILKEFSLLRIKELKEIIRDEI